MKRAATALLLLTALGGCVSMPQDSESGGAQPNPGQVGCYGGGGTPPLVPGVQGAWGQPYPMIRPYSAAPPGDAAARAMMEHSVPLNMVQVSGKSTGNRDSGVIQAGGIVSPGDALSPPGFPAGPEVIQAGAIGPAGAVAALGANTGNNGQQASTFPTQRTQVRFVRPTGMKVSWYVGSGGDKTGFTSTQIDTPGRYNFAQAAIYRLKLTGIEGRPGMVLYPTLEVVPSNSRTDPFLAHSAVPVEFTNEDLDQVAAGNYVVKVIYLPDPNFQDAATIGGLEEIVSSRLEAGMDPIAEAQRRGSILLVIRLSNIQLELENSPAMDAPSPYINSCAPQVKTPSASPTGPGLGLGMPGPGPMVPYGMMSMGNPFQAGPNGPLFAANGAMIRPPGQNGPMAQPSNPALRPLPNGLVMGPYGPMMMGPNGPVPANPAMLANPGAMPNPMLGMSNPGYGPQGPPLLPPSGPAPTPTGLPPATLPPATGPALSSPRVQAPVDQLPDVSELRRAQYTRAGSSVGLTTAQLAIMDAK
jgi:hypothetical protein